MQRHAEGHGHLWQKQAIVLNEQQEGLKTDRQPKEPRELAGGPGAGQGAGAATPSMAIAIPIADLDEKPSTSSRVVGITGTSGTSGILHREKGWKIT